MKPLLSQCAWCRSWINELAQRIQLPKHVNVSEHDISHGICQQCMSENIILAEQTNARARAEQST